MEDEIKQKKSLLYLQLRIMNDNTINAKLLLWFTFITVLLRTCWEVPG
jgi:hypothetical protein